MHKPLNHFYSAINSQEITGLASDSRLAQAGDIFFAIKGLTIDGNNFIDAVIKKGIKFIVTDNPASLNNPNIATNKVNIVLVEDARLALLDAINIFYPLLPQYRVAATGTNGKTSVVSYCRQLYSLLGHSSSSIGTMGVEYSPPVHLPLIQEILDQAPILTTPDPLTIRRIFHILATSNIHYIAFEASSHGLHQQRLDGIKVQAACFTSFSQDHLDYHKNMDSYLLAKLRLFTNNLLPSGVAVINSEIKQLRFVQNYLQAHNIKFLTVGRGGDVNITSTKQSIYGQNIRFTYKEQSYNFDTSIIGSFQAANLLIAAMMVQLTGFPFIEILSKLPKIKAVKGRLQRVSKDNSPYHVVIDYAHTPEALEKTLLELKSIKETTGLLKVIFGCGGGRDMTKRWQMGQVASKIADQIIITDDNPRHEIPALIRQQIIKGIGDNNSHYQEIADRQEAITHAITHLNKYDILLIAGKGHEEYQIIKDNKISFSDWQVATKVLDTIKMIGK